MNKKEEAAFKDLQQSLQIARSLRWPEYAIPAMLPVPEGEGLTKGWEFNAHRTTERVYRAWSKSSYHGAGDNPGNRDAGSQRGIPLFASRQDALKALRIALTEKYATDLAEIDRQIAAEQD